MNAVERRVPAVTSENSERSQDRIVWIDCEMTGLDLGKDALIEVAALVTDSQLNILGDGVDVVIKPPDGWWTPWWTWSAPCTPPRGCSPSWTAG